MISWETEKRKISELKPAEYNPRKGTAKQFKELKTSIERFDLADPIIINLDNTVIGGHFRLKVLKEKYGNNGHEIDVRVPNRKLSIEEEKELNLRLNKNLGDWDFDLLANFDEEFLKNVGFDETELNSVFPIGADPEDDEVPEVPLVVKTKPGDIYQLGNHRLMCGDSTNREHVSGLLNGKSIDMVFTDPPYGVAIGDKNKFLNKFQLAGRCLSNIANDKLKPEELYSVLKDAFSNIKIFLADKCAVYVTAPQGGGLGMMMMMMKDAGLEVKHVLNWIKNSPTFSMGRLDYDYQHEPILFTWTDTHKKIMQGQHKTSCWFIDKPKESKLHPTMKPVELIVNAVLNSSEKNDIVSDIFCGSGSTIIACEKTGRACYGMEIDPIYCDVIVKRWEDYTGKKSELL